jgi:pimeloyl-ACP methyl ester carboxylesterase
MDIVLMPGLWLQSSAWDETAGELRRMGHNPIPVLLPGTDDQSKAATLDDQINAALAAVDGADRPMVVGHSAASTLAWLVADRRADAIPVVAMIGGFPSSDGEAYADFFETVDGVMPFPGWEPFEGPDSADLDEATRDRIAADTVPVPEGVSKGIVRLTDESRYDVPVVMICPEYTPDEVREWLQEGHLPELSQVRNLSYVDIETGHWPMFSAPAVMARALDGIARGD